MDLPVKTACTLLGLTRDELAAALAEARVPDRQRRMRMRQIWSWAYNRGVRSFLDMTDISRELRQRLEQTFSLERPEIITEQTSSDGTRKWLLRLAADERGQRHEIETVYIPEEDRGTLCISSQVGCTLTCSFCHTGTQRLVRNLTACEIVGQVLYVARAHDALRELNRLNIVMMGQGEPLLNLPEVLKKVSEVC